MRSTQSDDPNVDAVSLGDSPEIEASLRRQRTLDAIRGLNAQFLEVLSARSADSTTEFPLSLNVRALLQALEPPDLSRLSRCGVLLVDAGFSDPARWRAAIADAGPLDAREAPHWLPGRAGLLLAHTTLHVAWSVLRWNRDEAALLLGVSAETADLIEALEIKDLSRIAEQRAHWIQPRWAGHPRAWLDLIEITRTDSPGALATLRALQLSGSHLP